VQKQNSLNQGTLSENKDTRLNCDRRHGTARSDVNQSQAHTHLRAHHVQLRWGLQDKINKDQQIAWN